MSVHFITVSKVGFENAVAVWHRIRQGSDDNNVEMCKKQLWSTQNVISWNSCTITTQSEILTSFQKQQKT